MAPTPQFFEMTPQECSEFLERNNIGRLAFRSRAGVDIQPLGYVARGKWIFIRSAYGWKLESLLRDPYVAFEVDDIQTAFEWRSVVVRGTIHLLDGEGSAIERREAQLALDAIRDVMPDAFGPGDPVPERQFLYGLNIHEMTGRIATSEPTKELARRGRITPRAMPAARRPGDFF